MISGFSKENTMELITVPTTEDTVKIVKEEVPPLVNYDYFEEVVAEVKAHRAERLVSLEKFLEKAPKHEKVIFDTRSY